MRSIAVLSGEGTLADLLRQASEENLVLTTEDGQEFLLAEIAGLEREIELMRQNEELMRLLDSRGTEPATVSLAEARARLGAG